MGFRTCDLQSGVDAELSESLGIQTGNLLREKRRSRCYPVFTFSYSKNKAR